MDSGPDESVLLERAAAGDGDAFGRLAVLHQARLRGFISRFVPDPDEAFDLAQDVFIQAYRCLTRFDRGLSFGKWLSGIALNLIRHRLRDDGRRRTRELKAVDEALRKWQAKALEPDGGGDDDRIRFLRECLEGLDAQSRGLIRLRYEEGRGLDAVAAALGKTVAAAAMQMVRIRAALLRCVRGKVEATG